MSQAQLSFRMGFKSNSFIAGLESNDVRKTYSASHYNLLALVLRCSVHSLLPKDPFPENNIIKIKNSARKKKIIAAIGKDIEDKHFIDEMFDVSAGNKIYLVFHEINKDRYLGVDEHKKVYLIMLDQKTTLHKTDIDFIKELRTIKEGRFKYEAYIPGDIVNILREPSKRYNLPDED